MELFYVLGRAAEEHNMDDFNVQELANAAWASAMLDQLDEAAFLLMAEFDSGFLLKFTLRR